MVVLAVVLVVVLVAVVVKCCPGVVNAGWGHSQGQGL